MSVASASQARAQITQELRAFLRGTHIRTTWFAQATVAPPMLAYVTSFPRLTIPLSGSHPMDIATAEREATARVVAVRGHAVFVGRDCWNKPDWSARTRVLNILFGKKQIGISLVRHDGRSSEPARALKTTVGQLDGVAQHLLSALTLRAGQQHPDALDSILVEALLHACLHLLESATVSHPRKAARTFESICLYVEENFSGPITRESVARHFNLTPNHVSRLLRSEGGMRFGDFLTRIRLERARFMLSEYDSPLKEIAAHCGFHDVAYFCRVFRRATQSTPTEFRLRSAAAGH